MTDRVTKTRQVYADASARLSDGVGAYALYVSDLDRIFVSVLDLVSEGITSPTQLEVRAVADAIDRFASPDVHLMVFSDCRDAVLAAQDNNTSPLVEVCWVQGHAGVAGQVLADAYAHVAAVAMTGQPLSLSRLARARRRFADLNLGRGAVEAHQAELDALARACRDLSHLANASLKEKSRVPALCG